MNKQTFKERLKDGKIVIGSWNIIPSPMLVEIIGYSGLDFIVIDSEHGPVNLETAENLIRAAEITGMTPIIRVSYNDPHLILRTLDIGAYGIQVPHISTKKEAELAVEYAKYHPKGKRGLSPFTRAGKYGLEEKNHVIRSNENTIVIINIEGLEGRKNLNDIVNVSDIDVIFIGPYDLSQSFGKPGEVEDTEIINFIKHSVRLLKDKGIACGSFARDKKYLEILVDAGVQYITYMVDSAVILNSYKAMRSSFVKLIAQGRELDK